MTNNPTLISAAEAAKLLGCSESNVRALIARGSLPDHSIPASLRQPRRVLTDRQSVEHRINRTSHRATPPGTISVSQAAYRANVHRSTVLGWIKQGKLDAELLKANGLYAVVPAAVDSIKRARPGRPPRAQKDAV